MESNAERASTSNANPSPSVPIARPRQLPGVGEESLGMENLQLNENSKARRRRRRRGNTLSSASFSSSLPPQRSRDVTDARSTFATPSQTDARPLRNALRRQSNVEPPRERLAVEAQSPVGDMYHEEYNMDHPRRGVALILNHMYFDTEKARDGTDKDCARLKDVLRKLGFEVRVETDLTYDRVLAVLKNLSQENHSLSDCLLVSVLTHGGRGELHASDHTYELDRLWMNFTADKCPSLAGKPKIFFVQACKGERLDPGTVMLMPLKATNRVVTDQVDASGGSIRYAIPNNADILIANATIDGFYAWRNPIFGSWFIQTLCDQLELNSERRDLVTILTLVACRVAVGRESDVPGSSKDRMKQIPCTLSMLTRLVYFKKKFSR